MDFPFKTYRGALEERYGTRTYKLTISGGRTCPTRDGTYGPKKGWGGCTFCDVHGSASYFANANKEKSVSEQMSSSAAKIKEKFGAEKFIAYFQSYTTTHQEILEYKHRYDEAIRFPGVVALAVGTRPDCLPDEALHLLTDYLDHVDVYLELGVQSLHNPTLDWFDRGHDAECAVESLTRAIKLSKQGKQEGRKGILDVSAHLIIGSPSEPDSALIETARTLNKIGVHGVKLHHLHILKKTKLEKLWKSGELTPISLEDYAAKAALFLRHLNPNIVIHRTHGTAPHPEELIGPEWTLWKLRPRQYLGEYMDKRGWKQGDLATV